MRLRFVTTGFLITVHMGRRPLRVIAMQRVQVTVLIAETEYFRRSIVNNVMTEMQPTEISVPISAYRKLLRCRRPHHPHRRLHPLFQAVAVAEEEVFLPGRSLCGHSPV
jgi:hypothetical protein